MSGVVWGWGVDCALMWVLGCSDMRDNMLEALPGDVFDDAGATLEFLCAAFTGHLVANSPRLTCTQVSPGQPHCGSQCAHTAAAGVAPLAVSARRRCHTALTTRGRMLSDNRLTTLPHGVFGGMQQLEWMCVWGPVGYCARA